MNIWLRRLKWSVTNAALVGVAWYGLRSDNEGFVRLATFVLWAWAAMTLSLVPIVAIVTVGMLKADKVDWSNSLLK